MSWKIATFNVNGIRARLKIVLDWLEENQPDVLCLQETKCQDKDFPLSAFSEAGYTAEIRGQKSYNGVALITKNKPQNIIKAFEDGKADDEARLIAAEIDGVLVVNTYVPQGRAPDDPAFQSKLEFFARLKDLFEKISSPDQRLVWTGDMNVAPEDIDVFDPVKLAGTVSVLPEERQAMQNVVSWGLVDLYRKLHPDTKQFTFWDYRMPKGFQRNLGWRLDHFMVANPLYEAVEACDVDMTPRGLEKPSDHTPVWATFNL